ncbi:hypothetical protein HanOQP8_Chr03g0097101 [Helianthus annuus]|nr:hypothetical protein HanOQP8_Chr03g0097101 [Helianthus annuus]
MELTNMVPPVRSDIRRRGAHLVRQLTGWQNQIMGRLPREVLGTLLSATKTSKRSR